MKAKILIVFIYLLGSCYGFSQGTTFKEAAPVWPVGMETEKNLTVFFRSMFIADVAKRYTLHITGSSAYRASINGKFLAHGPCVAAHGFYRLDQYAIDHLIKDGVNIVSIEVVGYNTPSFYLLNQPSFLQAEILSEESVVIATGSLERGFEASVSTQRKSDVPLYSHARPHTEFYKLSSAYNDWRINEGADFEIAKLDVLGGKKIISRQVPYPDYSVIHVKENLGDSIFRFPFNATGFLGFEINVTESAELIVYFDEILIDKDLDPTRLVCQNYIIYHLDPGIYKLETFEPYTLQFVKPVFKRGNGVIGNWFVRQYKSSDISVSKFNSSDKRLDSIYEAARETLGQNALDVLTDCPSRERGPWLGDGFFTARGAFTISGNARVEKNFFQNFLLPDRFTDVPEGMVPMCYPCDHPNKLFIPNWAMWFVIQLEEYQNRSGDTAMVEKLRDRVEGLIGYFDKFINEEGLLENLEKWVFIDWSSANDYTRGVNYPSNMQYARVLEAASNLYKNNQWREQAQKMKQVILAQSFNGFYFRDHALRKDGKLEVQTATTEACQYYAFYFGLASPVTLPDLWAIVKDGLGPKRYQLIHQGSYPDIELTNTFMGEYLRMELLCRYGYVHQFIEENTENLLRQVHLTGTLWEQQYRTLRTSCSHGFSTHVADLYRRAIAGFDEVNIAAKKVRVKFKKTELQWCKYSTTLEDGYLGISWYIKNKTLRYKIHLPTGYALEIINESGMKIRID